MKRMAGSVCTIVMLLFFLCPFLLHAQVIQMTGDNNSVNYERLAKIDGLINNYIQNGWVNGVTTIVVKDNHVVFHN